MTITLEVSDEQARRLLAQALRRGQSVEDYLLSLAEHEALTDEEWEAACSELTELIPDTVPVLPDEALNRTSMYPE